MGGFIASAENGVTTTLGRGGSDFSASLIGAALGVEEVQIWTDVDGVMSTNPSMIPGAHRVRVLSFGEASELAYFGAKVLHPSTMLPAVKSNIPVRVLNSRRPNVEGTLIVRETPPSHAVVKSIAYKGGITVVNVQSTRMLMAHGFLAKIFAVFERHATSVDMVTTSEVSVSLTVDRTERLADIIQELEGFAQVTSTPKQAIVCVVGEKIRYTPGVAGRVFEALNGINVGMISVGASRLNISLVIDEGDLKAAVEALHEAFFSEFDETVFA
jgi:aspartate kinase